MPALVTSLPQVVALTGAASGIGLASAHAFASRGASLVLLDADADLLAKAAADLGAYGSQVVPVLADVSDSASVAAAVRTAARSVSHVDAVVNSAGILRWGGTVETTEADWDAVLAVNLKGTWLASRAFVEHFAMRPGSAIVNVASNMGLKGVSNQLAYSASKGGVIALTRSMAVDLGHRGIRVNCVAPGHISTPMGDGAAELLGLTEEGIRSKYPLGRVGEATEVASAIVFLASAAASFMTGAIVPVDGGYLA